MTVHDLRTPVTAIKGFSQLALRKKDLPPDVRPYLDLIVGETNRVSALIDDLVLLARLEQGEESVRRARVDLAERLDAVARNLGRSGLGGRIAIQPTSTMPPAECDPALLERAIANLVRYALKFAHEDEAIALAVEPGPRGPAITVASRAMRPDAPSAAPSNGATPGADDRTSDDWEPRGLGTYIAGKLIEIQPGELWIDALEGGGVRFSVILLEDRRARSSPGGDQRWS